MSEQWQTMPPWMRRLWPGSTGDGHSTHVERRLTLLETDIDRQTRLNAKTDMRLTRLERVVLGLIACLHALVHERLPEWTKSLSVMAKLLFQT